MRGATQAEMALCRVDSLTRICVAYLTSTWGPRVKIRRWHAPGILKRYFFYNFPRKHITICHAGIWDTWPLPVFWRKKAGARPEMWWCQWLCRRRRRDQLPWGQLMETYFHVSNQSFFTYMAFHQPIRAGYLLNNFESFMLFTHSFLKLVIISGLNFLWIFTQFDFVSYVKKNNFL